MGFNEYARQMVDAGLIYFKGVISHYFSIPSMYFVVSFSFSWKEIRIQDRKCCLIKNKGFLIRLCGLEYSSEDKKC